MDVNIEEKMLGIFKEVFSEEVQTQQITLDTDLKKFGINSISFIKLIVAVESQFDIIFDNEDIDVNVLKTLRGFSDYIRALTA